MVFKKGEKRTSGKASQDKSQKPKTQTQGRKKYSKNRAETYSVYIYRVLK